MYIIDDYDIQTTAKASSIGSYGTQNSNRVQNKKDISP